MMKKYAVLLGLFLLVAWSLFVKTPSQAKSNQCIECHTNPVILKGLFKLPLTPPSEGEG